MRTRENLLVVIQILSHRDQVVLDIRQIKTLYMQDGGHNKETVKNKRKPTISDVGATLQFSLHRFANPFTTSALLPISRNKPITFFRQVPILRSMSLCSASFRINTNSSILSTSYSILWMSGPKASVISSMSAYEIQSEVTLI